MMDNRDIRLAHIVAHTMVGTAVAFVPGEAEMIITAGLDGFVKVTSYST